MLERIPYVLTIDVEPDERTYDPTQQPRWRGFETLLPEMARFRRHLANATGMPVHFTWLFRCDQQVTHTYGSPAWALERYRDEIAALRDAGDEIGVHTHAWRWDSTVGDWVADHGDARWVRKCVLDSLTAFRRATGHHALAFTHGDRFVSNDTIRTLARAGVAWDMTIEPGRQGAAQMRHGEHATGALPDLQFSPRLPFRPSPKDYLQPGVWRRRRLWSLPVTTGILPNPLTGSDEAACQTLLIGAPYSVMRQVFEGYLASSPLPVVASTGRSDVMLDAFNAEQLREFLNYLAEHPRRRELAFETPGGAITRFRAALASRGYSRRDHARLAIASRFAPEPPSLVEPKAVPLLPSPDLLARELVFERAFARKLQQEAANLRREVAAIEASRLGRWRRRWRRLRASLRKMVGPRTAGLLHGLAEAANATGRARLQHLAKRAFRAAYLYLENEPVMILRQNELAGLQPATELDPYQTWMAKNSPRDAELADYRDRLSDLRQHPVISVLLPVFNPPPNFLREAIDSVIAQVYPHWQLCIADDASTDPNVCEILTEYAARDPRIEVVRHERNRHISAATNSALTLATGEFCGFFDHDDVLAPDALFQMAVAIDREPNLDMLFSDEDKLDEQGRRCEPHFKPEFCPDTLLAGNYLCHFLVVRTALLREIGGLREGYEGAQDFDLVLRLAERTDPVRRVPRVLYHWRKHAASTALLNGAKPYAYVAGERAVADALSRRAISGTAVAHAEAAGHYVVRSTLVNPLRVTAIIATQDGPDRLRRCVESLLELTDHRDLSARVIDNGSREPATFELFREFAERYGERFATQREPGPFNWSRLVNRGVAATDCDFVLLLNNEVEILDGEWLKLMLEHAQRRTIGCVGAQLLDSDGTIQHGGVIVGGQALIQHAFRGATRGAYGLGNRLRTISNFSAVTGACMVVRRTVFEEVGGFDEAFAFDYSDIDFCLRVRRAGYWNLMVPDATLVHHQSDPHYPRFGTSESRRCHKHETALFRARWHAETAHDPCLSPHLRPFGGDLKIAG